MLYGVTFIDGAYRVAIAKEGRVWNHIVFMDGNKVRAQKTKEHLTFKPAGDKYSTLPKLARRMLRPRTALGTRKYFSKAARAILKEAKGG